jgi:hypothetical protein
MGLTKTLLNEMVWPAFTAMKSYIKPKTIGAVRHSAWDRFATILRRPEVGADELPGLEDLTSSVWNRVRDSIWQFKKEKGALGSHKFSELGNPSTVNINPTGLAPESTGTHELGHHLYSEVLNSKQLKSWRGAVKKHGRPVYEQEILPSVSSGPSGSLERAKSLNQLRAHPSVAASSAYRDRIFQFAGVPSGPGDPFSSNRELGEYFIANTESLAFALQEILTPGKEITTPVGMLREIERIFDAPGLIRRISHRIPPARNVFIGPLERPLPRR